MGFALMLAIWGILINDEMFIPDKTIWVAILVAALITNAILFFVWWDFLYERGWGMVRDVVVILFFGTMTGGAFAFFAINATNYYLKSDTTQKEIVTIQKTGYAHTGRRASRQCRYPYAEIAFDNIPLRINFDCDAYIADHKQMELILSKGGLGYYVIEEKSLVEIGEEN